MNAWVKSHPTQSLPATGDRSNDSPRTAILTWPPPGAPEASTRAPRPRWADPETANDPGIVARAQESTAPGEITSPGLPFRQQSRPASEPPPPVTDEIARAIAALEPAPAAESGPSAWVNQTIGQRLHAGRGGVAAAADERLPGAELPRLGAAHANAGAASDSVLLRSDAAHVHVVAVARPCAVVDLLWFDAKAMPRLRSWHRDILATERPAGFQDRQQLTAETPQELKDRTDIVSILTRSVVDTRALATLADGAGASGGFVAPLVTLEGTLRMTFAEDEELRALVAQGEILRARHADLAVALDEVKRLLEHTTSPGAGRALARGATFLRGKIRSALGEDASRRLDDDVEGILLEKRAYKRRAFLGTELLRASLQRTEEAVTYLPASLAPQLPLFVTMHVRMIAEVIPSQDQFEKSAYALRALVVARLLSQTLVSA